MFLEREQELGLLVETAADIGPSGGRVVLVRGEAGIGKSSLVARFLEAQGAGCHVLRGACDDLFIPQPLGPFWDMARAEPSLRDSVRSADRQELLEAMLTLLSRRPNPTIVIIEDTHWADEATLDALRYLGRRIRSTNGLLILTYRDGEVDVEHPLRGVIADIPSEAIVRLRLGGLTLEAVSALIGGSGLDPTDAYSATRGNPFLVREMALAVDAGVPASVHDSVQARMRRLSAGARSMLETLAVIPQPLPFADASRIGGVDTQRLDECERGGLLELDGGMVAFRHELIRVAIEAGSTATERLANNRAVLAALPAETYPSLLMHCAVEVSDIDLVLELAPQAARYAAATGSHIQAVRDYAQLAPYLDRIGPEELGPLLDDWAREAYLVDETDEAIRLNGLARSHYRQIGDRRAESRALAWAAQWHEIAGRRRLAEEMAAEALEVLGPHPSGADLARALEVSAYLQAMAGDVEGVHDLVERTLASGGPEIEEVILIRCLNHRGVARHLASYPDGRATLDEAWARASRAGQWYEEARALVNQAWAACEFHDPTIGEEYARLAVASASQHGISFLEGYAKAECSRALELMGEWDRASDLARDVLEAATISRMVAVPVIGAIEARRGRPTASSMLDWAWQMASTAAELDRLVPTATAIAEHAWISGEPVVDVAGFEAVMHAGLDRGYVWSAGKLACWLWRLGLLSRPPDRIAAPFRALMSGDATAAAAAFAVRGLPYERALALMHGTQADQLQALEMLETLGAVTVASRLRRTMRARGIVVPRGRGQATRRDRAGLTARQAEVLALLVEGLTNAQIADRLFISPRTAEHHVAAVFDKLDVVTREDAVAKATEVGVDTSG